MTRYTRGKPTHQRVSKESSSWEELRSTPIKAKNSRIKRNSNGQGEVDYKNKPEFSEEAKFPTTPAKRKHKIQKSHFPATGSELTETIIEQEKEVEEHSSECVKPKKYTKKTLKTLGVEESGFGNSILEQDQDHTTALSLGDIDKNEDGNLKDSRTGDKKQKKKSIKQLLKLESGGENLLNQEMSANSSPPAGTEISKEDVHSKERKGKKRNKEMKAEYESERQGEIPPVGSTQDNGEVEEANLEEPKPKKNKFNHSVKGFGKSQVVKIFGQFWVPPDDAERLQFLVTKLKEKGLSRKEITTALQNDRRRAEKAGKRVRDKTCFNCRQYGHVLNDCPKINRNNSEEQGIAVEEGTEICFKCGSTEHTSRKCRRKDEKYDFAKCFICSKTGHISRQCPQNNRGIYPSGGSCNVCGESTHLAKYCPSYTPVSGSNAIQVGKRKSNSNLSDVPTTLRIANPYASIEYEEDIRNTNTKSYQLKDKFTAKNQRIKF